MLLIGENLNVMSKRIGEAMRNRDAGPIQAMALAQAEAGVDMIDVNLGPARKDGPELMDWVVRTVQEAVDIPLSLDTTNIEAIEAGLRAARTRPLINSISARPERIEALMPMAKQYGAPFIALTLGAEGIPRDANERGLLAAELLAAAASRGIAEEDLWLDPIVLPVNTQQMQIEGCTEFVMMLGELAPQSKSTCGLSNVSNGCPGRLRAVLNRTYLVMLKRYGLYSAIVDAFDGELKAIAKGERRDIESLIHRVMDGEEIDPSSLGEEESSYVKTTRVLMGRVVYSDSWLDL
jgi:5-methyltetrahydrofolate corrinoid/iron sulfur protein methyltransferase